MKREIKKEDKQKLFVINLERILADKGMLKKDLADKLHCTPQTITNYCKRGVSEQQVAEIAAALEEYKKEREIYLYKALGVAKLVPIFSTSLLSGVIPNIPTFFEFPVIL